MRKELIITVTLVTFLLAWFGLPARAQSLSGMFCAVSGTSHKDCSHMDNCPMKHGDGGADRASMRVDQPGGKDRCTVYYHCGTNGKDGGKSISSQFKDSPFLTGEVSLTNIRTEQRLDHAACCAYTGPAPGLPDRPPAIA